MRHCHRPGVARTLETWGADGSVRWSKTGVLAVLLLAAAVVIIYRQGGFIREQVSPESSVLIAGDEGLGAEPRVGPSSRMSSTS